ncbi:ATP-binding protein [Streptomyces avermitilis]
MSNVIRDHGLCGCPAPRRTSDLSDEWPYSRVPRVGGRGNDLHRRQQNLPCKANYPMVISLWQQVSKEQALSTRATPRCRVTWEGGTATAVEGRTASSTFLSEVREADGAPLSDRLVGDIQLVVSELVTNAIRHAPGPCGLQVDLSADGRAVRVAVWDTSSKMPTPRPRDACRIGGHGLEIVRAVSRSVVVQPGSPGKQVTAEIELPQPARSESASW